jgi:biotin--protein ligase
LNKTDGDGDFIRVIDDLLAHDAGRNAFLRAIIAKLGLKMSSEDVPHGKSSGELVLTPIHISSTSEMRNRAIYDSLLAIADNPPPQNSDTFIISGHHDTFQVRYEVIPAQHPIPGDLESVMASPGKSTSIDPALKKLWFHSVPVTYPYFKPQLYFENLAPSSVLGRSLAYTEVTTSTQTLLYENPSILHHLPHGFVIIATRQLSGRGRAGNAWLSPFGILPFSFILRLPQQLHTRLVFMTYLFSLAVVEAIRTYATGWEDVNVKIKWPNDIYGKSRYTDRWEKIGGAMINSIYEGNEYILVVGMIPLYVAWLIIGCGINSMNPHPTTCLLNIIPEGLTPHTQEGLLAKIFTTFSAMYEEFLEKGFRDFEQKYYDRWLHKDQIVSIEGGLTRGKIVGINIEEGGAGGLLVEEVNEKGQRLGKKCVEVVADGNSFDIMKGLIIRKR